MFVIISLRFLPQKNKGNSLLAAAMSFGLIVGPGLGGFLAGYVIRVPLYTATGAYCCSYCFMGLVV